MYVCICNALRDKDFASSELGETKSVADAFKRCGARPQCGKCLPDVAKMIEDARDLENGMCKLAAE